jgi:hypothetical protein
MMCLSTYFERLYMAATSPKGAGEGWPLGSRSPFSKIYDRGQMPKGCRKALSARLAMKTGPLLAIQSGSHPSVVMCSKTYAPTPSVHTPSRTASDGERFRVLAPFLFSLHGQVRHTFRRISDTWNKPRHKWADNRPPISRVSGNGWNDRMERRQICIPVP